MTWDYIIFDVTLNYIYIYIYIYIHFILLNIFLLDTDFNKSIIELGFLLMYYMLENFQGDLQLITISLIKYLLLYFCSFFFLIKCFCSFNCA